MILSAAVTFKERGLLGASWRNGFAEVHEGAWFALRGPPPKMRPVVGISLQYGGMLHVPAPAGGAHADLVVVGEPGEGASGGVLGPAAPFSTRSADRSVTIRFSSPQERSRWLVSAADSGMPLSGASNASSPSDASRHSTGNSASAPKASRAYWISSMVHGSSFVWEQR